MKKLIITANPSKKSHTKLIQQKYQDISQTNWDEVKVLDLYDPENQQAFLSFEDIHDSAYSGIPNKHQELILRADELVFIFPVWRANSPAVLKNWIDVNFQAKFAFKYNSKWKIQWLLTWKTARAFVTSGAPSFVYKYIFPLRWIWRKWILWTCGIKTKTFDIFWKMHGKTDDTKILSKVESRTK